MSESAREQRKILVATDGSHSSQDAVRFAVELAADHESEVHFIHVVPTIDLAPAIGLGEVGIALPHEPSTRDFALLDEAEALARERGVAAKTALLGGSTAAEIVAYADSREVDMIVVGSNGHGAIADALLGSVSLGVLRASKRPVLIVHGAIPFHGAETRRAPTYAATPSRRTWTAPEAACEN